MFRQGNNVIEERVIVVLKQKKFVGSKPRTICDFELQYFIYNQFHFHGVFCLKAISVFKDWTCGAQFEMLKRHRRKKFHGERKGIQFHRLEASLLYGYQSENLCDT